MSTSPEHGVIHDIGYRHYDGPRQGRAAIRRAMFVEGLRGAYGLGRSGRSKVVPVLLLVAICLPALIIVIIAAVTGADELPSGYSSYALNALAIISVFVAAQAPVGVSRDLRFRTISLYFSRPMERVDYVRARYASLAVAVFVLVAIPLTLMLAGALLTQMPLVDQLVGYLRALVGAALLAVVLAGIGLLIASVTPRRGLGVAAIVAVLLVLSGVQAAVQSIASYEGEEAVAGYSLLLSPFTLVDGLSREVLGTDQPLAVAPPGALGVAVFALVTALVVAGCYGLLLLRYRKVSIS